jgi:hypothetical protein
MTVHLPARLTKQQIAGIAMAIRSCPAYGTLLHPPTVDVAFETAPAAADLLGTA